MAILQKKHLSRYLLLAVVASALCLSAATARADGEFGVGRALEGPLSRALLAEYTEGDQAFVRSAFELLSLHGIAVQAFRDISKAEKGLTLLHVRRGTAAQKISQIEAALKELKNWMRPEVGPPSPLELIKDTPPGRFLFYLEGARRAYVTEKEIGEAAAARLRPRPRRGPRVWWHRFGRFRTSHAKSDLPVAERRRSHSRR